MIEKMDPRVAQIIQPIAHQMQDFEYKKQFNPMIGQERETVAEKEAKRACVHLRMNGSDFDYALERRTIDNKEQYVCVLCDRIVYPSYDETAIKRLSDALEVINGYSFLLPGFGISPSVMQTFISIKQTWPGVIKICTEVNQAIRLQQNESKVEKSIVGDYSTSSILRMGGINAII